MIGEFFGTVSMMMADDNSEGSGPVFYAVVVCIILIVIYIIAHRYYITIPRKRLKVDCNTLNSRACRVMH